MTELFVEAWDASSVWVVERLRFGGAIKGERPEFEYMSVSL